MNKWLIVILMLGSGWVGWYLATHWPESEQQDVTADVLAVVGDSVITRDDFIRQMSHRGGNRPGQYHELKQKKFLLDFMINQQVMFDDAVAKGFHEDESVQKIYRKATVDKYLEEELNKKLQALVVTDREIKQHFNNNKTVYEKPARKRAAIIAKIIPADVTAEEKQQIKDELEAIRNQVNELDGKTKHFGELALTHSDDRSSRYQGGVIGWFVENPKRSYKWDRTVIEALFSLPEPGDVSPVLETDEGLFLVRLVAAEQVEEKTLTQVSSGIRQQLLKTKQDAMKKQFITQLIEGADININQQMLADIDPLNPAEKADDIKPPALPVDNGGTP
ncbi:peptidylprolyl isomerase [Marinicella sediminis]|uniref:peptidylprolyl isomerase n=1 Tax=Marinicella sediminis TaxID=1792834 RepID=A0ABV7JEE4_9GAMM|nr:peptidylprolyl isomerase [Marinicella sediminis]